MFQNKFIPSLDNLTPHVIYEKRNLVKYVNIKYYKIKKCLFGRNFEPLANSM